MTYYWLLFILILIINEAGAKRRNVALAWCIFLFFLFFAFRIGFTPDYYNYLDLFDRYHGTSYLNEYAAQEIGFQWMCQIFPSYRSIVILFTAFYCICLYIAFRWCSEKQFWWFAWIVLFCYTSFVLGNMSGMRSGFVTCFFFLALYIKTKISGIKGMIIAVALMAAAFMLHRSAIVLVPLLFISSNPIKKWVLYLIYAVAGVFIVVSVIFPNLLNDFALYMTLTMFDDFNYAEDFEGDVQTGLGVFSLIKTLILVYLLYTTLSYVQKEKDPQNNMFLKMTAAYYLLVLAPSNIGLISRFYYYFAFPCIIGTSITAKKMDKNNRYIYIACVLMYAVWQLYYFYRKGSLHHYLEYDSILFDLI